MKGSDQRSIFTLDYIVEMQSKYFNEYGKKAALLNVSKKDFDFILEQINNCILIRDVSVCRPEHALKENQIGFNDMIIQHPIIESSIEESRIATEAQAMFDCLKEFVARCTEAGIQDRNSTLLVKAKSIIQKIEGV